MKKIRWCYNAKTGEIFSYAIYDNGDTDFPRGDFLVYEDYLTTGMRSKKEAIAWAKEHPICEQCKRVVSIKEGKCLWCKGDVVFKKLEIIE
jgi:hypothetical protein